MPISHFRFKLGLVTLSLFLAIAALAVEPPTPEAARQLVHRYLHEIDCGNAERAAIPANVARFEARMLAEHWSPEQIDAAHAARQQALQRRSADCSDVHAQVRDDSVQYDPATAGLLSSAAAAGDRYALLSAFTPARDSNAAEQLRAQLYDVVHSGDALAISLIGLPLALSPDPGAFGAHTRAGDGSIVDIWLLVGCDLGLACGDGSRELDRICLSSGSCGYADVAAALRAARGEQHYQKIDQHRRELVERIRHNQTQGMFAPLQRTAAANS